MFHQMADECDEADFPFPNAETIHDGTWQTKTGIKIRLFLTIYIAIWHSNKKSLSHISPNQQKTKSKQ